MALHDTPHILNLVRGAEVTIAVVAALVAVAIELQVVVASMGVGQNEAGPGNGSRLEQASLLLNQSLQT